MKDVQIMFWLLCFDRILQVLFPNEKLGQSGRMLNGFVSIVVISLGVYLAFIK